MRLRYWAAGLAMTGSAMAMATVPIGTAMSEPVAPGPAEAVLGMPGPVAFPEQLDAVALDAALAVPARDSDTLSLAFPTEAQALSITGNPLLKADPQPIIWSREIGSGETLDALLTQAGLAKADRDEAALALGVEYDLRRLQPGFGVTVTTMPDGILRSVFLDVEDGMRVEAIFGAQPEIRVVTPDPETVTLAGKVRIASSLFAALDEAGIPERFAVDLAQILGGTVDFHRDLSGDETLRVLWREARLEGEIIGQPEIAFAALDLGNALYEIVWPKDGTGRATVYLDGEVVRVFAQPVEGSRVSSVFGQRKHPIYGNVRMHTGVDFAASRGTSVHATAPGRIAFIGRRGGYGRVVEIAHGTETMTRYAHLSAVPDGLAKGQRVSAGDMIGRVGATGTATGPNLHYEVRVDGRPTDPLSDERLAEAIEHEAQDGAGLGRLTEARARLEDALSLDLASSTPERL